MIDATTCHGRIAYVGWGGTAKNAAVGPMLGERCLMGSNMFTETDYYELVRLMHRTGLRFADLVTHRFPLADAQQAFDPFAGGRTGKVTFTWD
ncbi:MAG: hypothetical protein OXJ62_09550 [Spirochaetaceae bacterium]|nr:hypothetical protein [Spirochaetaceae bacterium]